MNLTQWIESDDCVAISSSSNGFGRGDGYDVAIYSSTTTSRYIVVVDNIEGSSRSIYMAYTLESAKAVDSPGYTPGQGPGMFQYISSFQRVKESGGVDWF